MDNDGSGEIGNNFKKLKDEIILIEYTEFLAGFMENMLYKNINFLKYAYKKVDRDGSGEITVEDFEIIMKEYKLNISRY